MRLKTCTTLGGVFRNIAATRAGSISTPARIGGTRTRKVAAA